MFRDVKVMTIEELEKELHAIEIFEKQIVDVNVNTMLDKSIDTSFLQPMQCAITPNGQLFRTDVQGFLPAMMERMYEDRTVYKKKMIQAQKELEKVNERLAQL